MLITGSAERSAAIQNPAADGLIASPEAGWPQWRGLRRDGMSPETGLLSQWPPAGPPVLWQTQGLGRGWASPIVVGPRLYLAGERDADLVIHALDTRGKILWQVKNGSSWQGPYPGARASCAYAAGRLYHMNAHGRVICLDAEQGTEIWHVDILERFQGDNITWALSECLLVDGDRVIVTPGGRGALMAALDARDGKTLWTTPPLEADKTSHCSPILFRYRGRRVISNCSSAHGFGVDAETGKLLWTVPLKNKYGTNVSTPVYGDGRIFYVTPYAELGRQYRLEPGDAGWAANHRWTSPIDTVTGGGVLVDETLFMAGYNRDRWWRAIDWQTGATRYEYRDLTTGAAIHADGHLYVLDQQGRAGLLQPTPEGLRVAGRFDLVRDRVRDAWTHPVLCDGRLYLRYHETLWCFDVKQP
jgi:outer membrane protein assembly factor BamB